MWVIVLYFALGGVPPFAYVLDPTTGQMATYSTKAACQSAITVLLSSAANPNDGLAREPFRLCPASEDDMGPSGASE